MLGSKMGKNVGRMVAKIRAETHRPNLRLTFCHATFPSDLLVGPMKQERQTSNLPLFVVFLCAVYCACYSVSLQAKIVELASIAARQNAILERAGFVPMLLPPLDSK